MRHELSLYLSRPSFEPDSLRQFAELLLNNFPPRTGPLVVLKDEDDDAAVEAHDPQRLSDAVHAKARIRGGLGSVLVRCDPEIQVYMASSTKTLPLEGNVYSLEVDDTTPEGKVATGHLASWFQTAVATLSLRYANGFVDEERESKNIVDDTEGYRAVGVDYHTALPGLYWLNFFGPDYVALMGKEKLLSAPAYRVAEVGNGIFLQLHANADEWNQPHGIAREEAVEAHIGAQYFFSKKDPSRTTVAPDFWKKR